MAFQDALGPAIANVGENYFRVRTEEMNHARDRKEREADLAAARLERRQEMQDSQYFQSKEAEKQRAFSAEQADKAVDRTLRLKMGEALQEFSVFPRLKQVATLKSLGIENAEDMTDGEMHQALLSAMEDEQKRKVIFEATLKYQASAATKPQEMQDKFALNNTVYDTSRAYQQKAEVAVSALRNYDGKAAGDLSQLQQAVAEQLWKETYGSMNEKQREQAYQKRLMNPVPADAPPLAVIMQDMYLNQTFKTTMENQIKFIATRDTKAQALLMEAAKSMDEAATFTREAVRLGVNPNVPKTGQDWYDLGVKRNPTGAPEVSDNFQPSTFFTPQAAASPTPTPTSAAPAAAPAAPQAPRRFPVLPVAGQQPAAPAAVPAAPSYLNPSPVAPQQQSAPPALSPIGGSTAAPQGTPPPVGASWLRPKLDDLAPTNYASDYHSPAAAVDTSSFFSPSSAPSTGTRADLLSKIDAVNKILTNPGSDDNQRARAQIALKQLNSQLAGTAAMANI